MAEVVPPCPLEGNLRFQTVLITPFHALRLVRVWAFLRIERQVMFLPSSCLELLSNFFFQFLIILFSQTCFFFFGGICLELHNWIFPDYVVRLSFCGAGSFESLVLAAFQAGIFPWSMRGPCRIVLFSCYYGFVPPSLLGLCSAWSGSLEKVAPSFFLAALSPFRLVF